MISTIIFAASGQLIDGASSSRFAS